jgi:membrane-anchored glycerophosphoryl diester phosphodiesterase (GDPDase)
MFKMDPDYRPDQDELDSPYAPPDSTFAQEFPQAPFGRIPFNVGDIINWTWSLYKEQFGTCLGIFWGVYAINLGISFGINILVAAFGAVVRDQVLFAIMQIAVTFGGFVVQIWLNVGTNLVFLKIVRREVVVFQDVFTGGQFVLTTILAMIVFGVAVGGLILLAFLGGAAFLPLLQDQLSVLPLLMMCIIVALFVSVAFYISTRLLQFYFVVIDRNAGVIESLRTSWSLTRNHVANLILVYLLQTAIILAGFLAFCVGLVFALPLSSLLLAVTYQALTGQTPVAEVRFLDTWDFDQNER